ncbi:MAG: metal-dependent transcriptional regulator [Bacteroidota bacterium]
MEISLVEENYIKAIYKLQSLKEGEGVSTSDLSRHLKNKAASVTDMLKRLSLKKLIQYQKYQGVFLSAKGQKIALEVLRKHRLWEVFLMEKLHFKWDEVHDIAEQMEHIKSEELVQRLDAYLGHPKVDPHGDPIPNAKGLFQALKSKTLNHYSHKGKFIFTGVTEHSKSFLQYLSSINLKIGHQICIEEVNAFDGSIKVRINKQQPCFFSEKVSANILVEVIK